MRHFKKLLAGLVLILTACVALGQDTLYHQSLSWDGATVSANLTGTNAYGGTNTFSGPVVLTNVDIQIYSNINGAVRIQLSPTGAASFAAGAASIDSAGIFHGDGSSLINLNANQISGGTLADTRLSANVALLNRATQTFTGSNTFGGVIVNGASTNNGSFIMNGANFTLGSNAFFNWFWNNSHSGGGEFQMLSPNWFIGPQSGGHIQLGLGSDTLDAVYVQYAALPANNQGSSHELGWRYIWSTNSIIARWDSIATNYDPVTGDSVLNFWVDPTNNWGADTDLSKSTNAFSLDSKGLGAAVIQGGIKRKITTSSPGSTYSVDFSQTDENVVNLGQATTFSIANVSLTNQQREMVLWLYPGPANVPITLPAACLSSSESGLQVLPTNCPGSNIMRLSFEAVYGTTTNIFVNYRLTPYTFLYDTNASNFFVASGIVDAPTRAAVNNRVLNAKSHGYWAKLIDYHPMVGGTSNTCSWNLVNTNLYRINWSGGLTFATTGVTGNGTTGVGDLTGLNPNTELASATNSFAGIYVRGPATPTTSGWFFGCNDATSGGRREGIRVNAGQANFEGGGMNNNTISDFVITASGSFIGYCFQNRVGTATEYDSVKGNAPVLATTFTAVNGLPALDMFVLARQDTSAGGFPASADAWSNAEVNDFAFGTAFTTQNMTDFLADEAAFKTALGR